MIVQNKITQQNEKEAQTMNRLEAIGEVEKWRDSVTVVTEEDFEQLYEVYYEKLEAIDNQCEGYTDYEDVPNLHF